AAEAPGGSLEQRSERQVGALQGREDEGREIAAEARGDLRRCGLLEAGAARRGPPQLGRAKEADVAARERLEAGVETHPQALADPRVADEQPAALIEQVALDAHQRPLSPRSGDVANRRPAAVAGAEVGQGEGRQRGVGRELEGGAAEVTQEADLQAAGSTAVERLRAVAGEALEQRGAGQGEAAPQPGPC